MSQKQTNQSEEVQDNVKTISNGKRGRNPLAPSEQVRQAFVKLGLEGKEDVQDVIAQVAEIEDTYAEVIEQKAAQERTKRKAKAALASLSQEEINEMLAEVTA